MKTIILKENDLILGVDLNSTLTYESFRSKSITYEYFKNCELLLVLSNLNEIHIIHSIYPFKFDNLNKN